MLWIKEVEMVESVDDLKSSCSVRGTQGPDFEVLDAKIASALNRITHNTQFKKKVSLEEQKAQKEDRFLRWRQIAYLIYEFFQVTGADDPVDNCADLFTTVLRNDGNRFEMGRNSIVHDENPAWWHLGKFVQIENTRVWKTRDRIGIVQHGDSSEKNWTWLSQIEDNGEKNYRAESTNQKFWSQKNGNYERNAVVKNQGTKQREQRTLGDCWQWEANGQCSKGDSCSFRHDINKRAKSTQPNCSPSSSTRQNGRNASRTRSPRGKSPSGRMYRWPCKDYLKGTCTNSFCEKWRPPECLFYKSESGCRIGESALIRFARLKNSPAKGLKRMVTKVQWLCWKVHDNWFAYFRIWSRRSLHRFCGRAQTYGNRSDV